MALYAPFYAGKNAPVKAKRMTLKKSVQKAKTVKSVKTVKTAKAVKTVTRKNTPVRSPKSSCSDAARRLSKCRGPKRNAAHAASCKQASKTLYGCRKQKQKKNQKQ